MFLPSQVRTRLNKTEFIAVKKPLIRQTYMRNDGERQEGQGHYGVGDGGKVELTLAKLFRRGEGLRKLRRGQVGHKSRDGKREQVRHLAVFDGAHSAAHGEKRIYGKAHILVVVARADHVMAVVRDGDSHRSALDGIA